MGSSLVVGTRAGEMPLTSLPSAAQADLLAQTLWHVDTPAFLFDAQGGLIYVNRAGMELAGLRREAVGEARWQSIFPLLSSPRGPVSFDELISGEPGRARATVRRDDQTTLTVPLQVMPVGDAAGGRSLMCLARGTEDPGQARRDQILARISGEITSAKSLPDVLRSVAKLMVDVAGPDHHATITLLDKEEEHFVIQVEHPAPATTPLAGAKIPIKGNPTQELIMREKMPVCAVDLEGHSIVRESRAVREMVQRLGVKSMLVMPMVYRGRLVGTISVDALGERREFPVDDLDTYQAIANQAAVAIENARLVESGQRLTRQAELLLGPPGGDDAQGIIEAEAERILSKLAELVEYQKAGLQLIEDQERILLASVGYDRKSPPRHLLKRVDDDPTIQEPVESGRVKIVPDTNDPTVGWQKGPETYDVNSWMGIPLVAGGVTIAVVHLDHDTPGYYGNLSAETHDRLRSFVEQAASDLQTALLRRHIQGLELLHRITGQVLKATKLDAVLKEIVFGAMQVTRRDSGVIFLIKEGRITESFSPRPEDHPHPRMHLESGITRTMIETRKPVEIPNIALAKDMHPIVQQNYKSMNGFPLLLRDEVVGVLYLNGNEVGGLSNTELSLVQTLVDQATIVVQRTRLYQQIQDSYQQIKDSEAEYRSLVDYIPVCVFRKDKNLRFVSANKAFRETLKRSWEQIKGKGDRNFYPRELAKKYEFDDLRVMAGEVLQHDEPHQSDVMAKPIWVRVFKTPVRDAKGNISGVQAIFWDVSLEKKMRERYEGLVQQSPDGIVLHEKGVIRLANPAAALLLGFKSAKELEGRKILDFVDERDVPHARERLEKLERGERIEDMVEMRIRRSDGDSVYVAVYSRRLPESGEIHVAFHDLTRVNSLLGEMRHRVRHALNYLKGCLRYTKGQDNTLVEEVLSAVEQRIYAMAKLHTILLPEPNRADVPMGTYLADLTEAVREAHGGLGNQVAIDLRVDDGLAFNEKTAGYCGLIVTELVSNAVQHGFRNRGSGRVKVRVTKGVKGAYYLSVADNGEGFNKLLDDRSKHGGLALVRGFAIADLKGKMRVRTSGRGVAIAIRFRPNPKEAGHGR